VCYKHRHRSKDADISLVYTSRAALRQSYACFSQVPLSVLAEGFTLTPWNLDSVRHLALQGMS
jgi:hypothetical protein